MSFSRCLKASFPGLHRLLARNARRYFGRFLGVYPRPLANEVSAVKSVLYEPHWNMAYGRGLVHEKLEADFAKYVGCAHAIAVNTGGMALQMSMRALGLKPGNEVLLQVDTCSATAFAVMNAGCTPIFSDIDDRTFMLARERMEKEITDRTKAVIATHMWGNAEDMASVLEFSKSRNLSVIEDACLSLGTRVGSRMAGSLGHVGVFSFGCLKPIQGGEGGMIVTNDDHLARELRSLRHWGDRTIDFGKRDVIQLAWNGRMSEIVAAVVREQLKGYPRYLEEIRVNVGEFKTFLEGMEGLELVLGNSSSLRDSSFTQVVLRLDAARLRTTKAAFMEKLAARQISAWTANFEAIPSLTFFENDLWKEWILGGDLARISKNYHQDFPTARNVFDSVGVGINKSHFLSASKLKALKRNLEATLS